MTPLASMRASRVGASTTPCGSQGGSAGTPGPVGYPVVMTGAVQERLPARGHAREHVPVEAGNAGIGQPFDVPLHHQGLVDQMPAAYESWRKWSAYPA
jgi:hypothetical protein